MIRTTTFVLMSFVLVASPGWASADYEARVYALPITVDGVVYKSNMRIQFYIREYDLSAERFAEVANTDDEKALAAVVQGTLMSDYNAVRDRLPIDNQIRNSSAFTRDFVDKFRKSILVFNTIVIHSSIALGDKHLFVLVGTAPTESGLRILRFKRERNGRFVYNIDGQIDLEELLVIGTIQKVIQTPQEYENLEFETVSGWLKYDVKVDRRAAERGVTLWFTGELGEDLLRREDVPRRFKEVIAFLRDMRRQTEKGDFEAFLQEFTKKNRAHLEEGLMAVIGRQDEYKKGIMEIFSGTNNILFVLDASPVFVVFYNDVLENISLSGHYIYIVKDIDKVGAVGFSVGNIRIVGSMDQVLGEDRFRALFAKSSSRQE